MKQAVWILATLLSHWRRHPLNLATLIVGLATATALWSGVQALNMQARLSYESAATVLGGPNVKTIVGTQDAMFSQAYFVTLRRAGFKVSPIVEGTVRIGGKTFRLLGIEPVTLPSEKFGSHPAAPTDFGAFLRPPGQALVRSSTREAIVAAAGTAPVTDRGHDLPPLTLAPDVAPGVILVDIGIAQKLLERQGQVSRLLIGPNDAARASEVGPLTGGALRMSEPDDQSELSRMTDSFHLNLTAFGLLAFIVGFFIVRASVGLAFEQRLGMIRTMRAVGVPLALLIVVLITETLLLALLAGAIGIVGGYFIAAALLPNVAVSLQGLYGAAIDDRLAIAPAWWLSGLAMAAAGAFAASATSLNKVARLPLLAAARPVAWRQAQRDQLRWQGLMAAASFAVALATFIWGRGLISGFVIIAGILLGAGLIAPLVFAEVLKWAEAGTSGALSRWFWADSRQQLSGLSMALTALLLALSTNVGVGSMVEGFRKTFTGWLDERLNSEVYFEARSDQDAASILSWLNARPEVRAVLPVWKAETRIGGWPVDVFGMRDHATYRDHFVLLNEATGAWDRLQRGEGAFISEQLARRLSVGLGDDISIPAAAGIWRSTVLGVYPDYGNAKGQLRVGIDTLTEHWPAVRRATFSLRAEPSRASGLIADMQTKFGPALNRIIDQASLKEMSVGIFDKTFAVTAALNSLTLVVSGAALFASLLTLSDRRLAQIAPVWAAGVPRRHLARIEILKIMVLAALTALLAIPLGLVLAWCLVAIVNVEAFGWRLPFHVFPAQWALVIALATLVAFLAAIVPVIRLSRTRPGDLLKVFANES